VRIANALVAEKQPWAIAKDPARADELDAVLATMVRYLAAAAVLLSPFMPVKMAELWERLGSGRATMPSLDELAALDVSGWKTSAGAILFPRPEVAAAA
jgi:methionyl-tRNA synthetase